MANQYYPQMVRVSAVFTVNSVDSDPTTVKLTIVYPGGSELAYTYAAGEITKSATGRYYKDLPKSLFTDYGRYFYIWEGSGTCEATDQDYFDIRKVKSA